MPGRNLGENLGETMNSICKSYLIIESDPRAKVGLPHI